MHPFFGINYVNVSGDGIDSLKQKIKNDQEYYNTIQGVNSSGGIHSKIGIHTGYLLDYYFVDAFAISSGLLYSQKGYVVKNFSEITTGYDYKSEQTMQVNLNYLDVPLLIKYNLNNKVQLSSGVLLSFLQSDKVLIESVEIFETIDTISGDIITVSSTTNDEEDYSDIIDNDPPNFFLYGFQLNVSYTIKRISFSFRLSKSSSFGNIVGRDNNQNITLQFSSGFSF